MGRGGVIPPLGPLLLERVQILEPPLLLLRSDAHLRGPCVRCHTVKDEMDQDAHMVMHRVQSGLFGL